MKLRTIALASAALLVLSPATVAGAAPPDSGGTLHEGLSFPLHLAVGPGKAVTVSESFVGKMTTVSKGKATAPYANDGWDVAGLDYHGSALFFVKSVGAGPDPRDMVGSLKAIDNKGNVTTITDQLAQFEIDHNVDAGVPYGLSPEDAAAYPACVAMLAEGPNPASYTGAGVEVDSHVYGLAVSGNTAYVADAGANAVFSVNLTTGAIATVALLPRRPSSSPTAHLALGSATASRRCQRTSRSAPTASSTWRCSPAGLRTQAFAHGVPCTRSTRSQEPTSSTWAV